MKTITMSVLGRKGRWGNQIFQYMFLRTYARRYGAGYQCNDWVGQEIRGYGDLPIYKQLPTMRERLSEEGNELAIAYPPEGDAALEHDYNGYCQYHTSYYSSDREFIRGLFIPSLSIRLRMQSAVALLQSRGKTIVGLHMRRGDTGRLIYYLTPNAWYLAWLEEHWRTFDNPVLLIASESPSDREVFAKYSPIMSSDLVSLSEAPYPVYNYLAYDLKNPTPISMDWFPDWYLLTQCNVLVFGNSSFSFTAAMMASALQSAWRSRLSTQKFDLIDPWNTMSLVREDLRNYPGVADTWYDRNPQWVGGETLRRRT